MLDVPTDQEVSISERFRVRYCHRIKDVSVSPTLLRLLPEYTRDADVVHLTAVYSFPTIPTLLACKAQRKPLVWSPRGMLQRWKGTRKQKLKSVWDQICKIVSPEDFVLHCTSEEEASESIERIPGVQTVVIPNAVEIPEPIHRNPNGDRLRFLYFGRLDPKKGIENLLQAFQMLNGNPRCAPELTIAGNGDVSYSESIRNCIASLHLEERVRLIGAVEPDAKADLFANADVTVIPSFTENFGIVVAESLAHGVPVIASKGTPWKKVEQIGCGLWVENDPRTLAVAMRKICTMPISDMGNKGRAWMKQEFSEELMAQKMLFIYDRLART